jgi:hypothetical protein
MLCLNGEVLIHLIDEFRWEGLYDQDSSRDSSNFAIHTNLAAQPFS